MGRGARRWLRVLWVYVRRGRRSDEVVHAAVRSRFAKHWKLLESDVWRPLMERARERDAANWGHAMIDWRCNFLAIVAETAYWWAYDFETEPERTQSLRAAANELRAIDDELVDLAGDIADALDRRSEILETYGLDADWNGPGPDLWSLLEAVANLPQFQGTCLDSNAKLLTYMRGTSRSTPHLADLMRQLENSIPGGPYAHYEIEAEALAKTKGTKPGSLPERVRLFFAALAKQEWQDTRGCEVTALDCFSPVMLATLLRVFGGFDPHNEDKPLGLTTAAVEKALNRFRGDRRQGQHPGDRRTT